MPRAYFEVKTGAILKKVLYDLKNRILGVKMKILAAQLNYTVGDFKGNTEKILSALQKARDEKIDLVTFSELAICGYPPEDLLLQEGFIDEMESALQKIINASADLFVIVGLARKNPSKIGKPFFNSAAVIDNGALLGFYDKWLLPTYDVFDEARYFESGNLVPLWECKGKKIGVLICEDIWGYEGGVDSSVYLKDPVEILSHEKVDFLINLSASPYHFKKLSLRTQICKRAVKTLNCPLIFCSQVGGNDQLVFDGQSFFVDANSDVLSIAKGFEEDLKIWDTNNMKKEIGEPKEPLEELFSALVLGVKDYFYKNNFKKACLGLSGGIDSAVVACIAVKALGNQNVEGIYMPSRYSSKSSEEDAKALADSLGISLKEISIEAPFESYLNLLSPYFGKLPVDHTEENVQARIRGAILMAFSNKFGSIVLSTSNKSEMALGFATLYGDLCGGLSVISDLTKKQVYEIAHFINLQKEIIPLSSLQKEPSAELRHGQKDSDSLPSYDLLDVIVESHVEFGKSAETIALENQLDLCFVKDVLHRIYQAEYKRRQSPLGIRVSQKSFKDGRRIPIVQKWT